MVLSDAGNIYDALFMAARAALWDTRVPRTRAVEYRPDNKDNKAGNETMDVNPESQSALDTRRSKAPATDFELEDSLDDGVVLGGQDVWPLSVTLNLVPNFFFFLSLSFILNLLFVTDVIFPTSSRVCTSWMPQHKRTPRRLCV